MLDAISPPAWRSMQHRPGLAAETLFETRRTGLVGFLFAILHPRHARAASVNAEAVRLLFGSRPVDISLGDVEKVDVAGRRRYSSVRIRHAAGSVHVSGLSRTDANALAETLETARCDWWRRTITPQLETLRVVHGRLTALADPPRYLTADALRDLQAVAQTVARQVHDAVAGSAVGCSRNPNVLMKGPLSSGGRLRGVQHVQVSSGGAVRRLVLSGRNALAPVAP